MNSVAEECKKKRHHPEWTNVRVSLIPLLLCESVDGKGRYIIKQQSHGRRIDLRD